MAGAPALQGRASLWVDLLGFGRSPRPQDYSYDLADQAEVLAELLMAGGEPLVLIGHSMGGTLAVMLAEKLHQLGAPLKAVLVAEPNLRPEDAGMSARAASKPLERFVQAWPRWVETFPSAHYRKDMELADPVAFHRSAVSLVRHGAAMLERLVRLPVPRGYILGGLSEPFTQETARLVAEAGVPVATVERSGHGFSADDPEGFAAAIAGLLDRFGLCASEPVGAGERRWAEGEHPVDVLPAAASGSAKAIATRFDFRGSNAGVSQDENQGELTVIGDDEMKLRQVITLRQGIPQERAKQITTAIRGMKLDEMVKLDVQVMARKG